MRTIALNTLFLLFILRYTTGGLSNQRREFNEDKCVLKSGWYLIDYSNKGCKKRLIGDTSTYSLVETPLMTTNDIVKVDHIKFMDKTPGLLVTFNSNGTKRWEKVTGNHVGDLFAFVLNDKLLTVGANASKISTGKAFFGLPRSTDVEVKQIKADILKR